MEIVFLADSKDTSKIKDMLSADPLVSLASLIFKDGKSLGKEGFYVYISGLDSQCQKALELTKDIVKVLEGDEKEEIISKIKDEQMKSIEGFGGVFGDF